MKNVFAERLKMLRQEKEIGQIALAKELGVGKSSVSQWEIGKCEPKLSNLVAMSKYFGVSIDYLAGLED
ncbi:MAG: helix-turn-helix domain-containing protein [Bacteroides sp.]|nr:helix-turn-helix domain-containing protein [Bacillota bacterium]MCM1393286.1 helix-turn-helix domain-containing protein [[Eubacterium] siraeum]MCM1455411.1 helix-turn-helix domain-containing protein [Bacteroides sp.]